MQGRYFYIVLVVSVYFESGRSETVNSSGNETEEENTNDIVTDHTFVALIDIVYTDGSKRSCTGAIIDDNVVVTAAHCFVVDTTPDVKPELTASFVVIGTKKMFETGYEQYLPIERVQTHPKFHGWTADICLVHTYAAMTGDKPGSVIQLAGAKLSEHVDVNFTVLSWGKYGDIDSVSLAAGYRRNEQQQAKENERNERTNVNVIEKTSGRNRKEHASTINDSHSFGFTRTVKSPQLHESLRDNHRIGDSYKGIRDDLSVGVLPSLAPAC